MLKVNQLIGFGVISGCKCTPAYVTGNRTSSITVTTTYTTNLGTLSGLVNGAIAGNSTDAWVWNNQANSGLYVRFDFGSGNSIKVTEVKWYESNSTTHGTHKWQGSNDALSWTDLTSSFTLGATPSQTHDLSSNTKGYRYYQLLGVSGSVSQNPWQQEVEFKQCTC